MTDGIEAVRQAVVKTLQTERYMHLIYSGDQGSELGGLPGRETAFVRAEFGRRLRAALLIDDRISDVRDIQLQMNGDELVARFTVMSAFGQFTVQEGVTSRVRTTNL